MILDLVTAARVDSRRCFFPAIGTQLFAESNMFSAVTTFVRGSCLWDAMPLPVFSGGMVKAIAFRHILPLPIGVGHRQHAFLKVGTSLTLKQKAWAVLWPEVDLSPIQESFCSDAPASGEMVGAMFDERGSRT
jgi:hypothetical protein